MNRLVKSYEPLTGFFRSQNVFIQLANQTSVEIPVNQLTFQNGYCISSLVHQAKVGIYNQV
jgi:hypothetical protein